MSELAYSPARPEVKLDPFRSGNGARKQRKLRARPKTRLGVLLLDLMNGANIPLREVADRSGISLALLYQLGRLPWGQAHDLATGRQRFPSRNGNGHGKPPKSVEARLDELIAEVGVDRVFNRVRWLRVMRVPSAPPTFHPVA